MLICDTGMALNFLETYTRFKMHIYILFYIYSIKNMLRVNNVLIKLCWINKLEILHNIRIILFLNLLLKYMFKIIKIVKYMSLKNWRKLSISLISEFVFTTLLDGENLEKLNIDWNHLNYVFFNMIKYFTNIITFGSLKAEFI